MAIFKHCLLILLFLLMQGSQTGKYVLRAEDLPPANKFPYAQRPIKRAKCEKYTCKARRFLQMYHYIWGSAAMGVFSKTANLTGKISSARREQTFQSGRVHTEPGTPGK